MKARVLAAGSRSLFLSVSVALAAASPLAAAPETLTVPSSASIHGLEGAFFHTDLWVMNRSFTNVLFVTAGFRCFTGPCPAFQTRALTLPPRESQLLSDVVGAFFGAPETAGAIELTWEATAGQLSALSRVYTPSLPAPTFGTAIPALPSSAARSRALFLGLGNNGGQAGGFRSNAGAYNPNSLPATVTFQLQDASGANLGSPVPLALGAKQAGQINNIFAAAGVSPTVSRNVQLLATATLGVFFNVTVIDNQSGDSVFALESDSSPGASSHTLLSNGTFDQDVTLWNPTSASYSATFVASDATGDADSGAARVTNAVQGAVAAGGIGQCAHNLTGGAGYHLAGKARILPGQTTHGGAQLRVFTYASGDCTGTIVDDVRTNNVSAIDSWQAMTAGLTTSAGVNSALVFTFLAKDETTGAFEALFDDLAFTEAKPATLTVPASASIHGQAGTFFHTDLWAANRSATSPLDVTARLRCATGVCTEAVKTFSLAPRESKLFEDVVGSFFLSPESSAAIELTYDSGLGQVAATTRTYTPSLPAPTNGTTIPAQPTVDVKIRALFLGLGSNAGNLSGGVRTNVGAYNPLPLGTSVTLSLYDGGGHIVGQKTYPWGAFQAKQVNDVFADLGVGGVSNRNAYVVATAPLPMFFYATVIDNQSGDSVYVFPSDDEAAPQ